MSNGPVDRKEVLDKIDAAFAAFDKNYKATQADLWGGLEELNSRMDALIGSNNPRPVAQQISLEAQWLINYTDDWERAGATLERLETSLGDASQKLEQQPDGSWGPGCTEFYRKLEPTIDALLNDVKPGVPIKPLAFMQQLQDPKFVTDYLERLRVSRIHQDRRNNRDEFGSAITSLAQLFFKKAMRDALGQHKEAEFKVTDESCASLRDYLWRIQGDITGFWGPTYDFDGDVVEVQDLSYTFHVVKYYNDGEGFKRIDLPNTKKIVGTIKTIESYYYPNGLKPLPDENGRAPAFSDHNNYDLVTMFQQLWNGMKDDTRADARQEIESLLAWCLTQSIDETGQAFNRSQDMSVVNSYYYGVRFLLLAGLWPDQQRPFWTPAPVPVPAGTPPPAQIAANLLAGFKPNDDGSANARKVRGILTKAAGVVA